MIAREPSGQPSPEPREKQAGDERGSVSAGPDPQMASGTRNETDRAEGQPKTKRARLAPAWHAGALTSYYLVLFCVLFYLALDVWTGQFNFLTLLGFRVTGDEAISTLKALSYTIIGGAIGSILYSIRMFFTYYAGYRREHYSPRWLGKYVTAPWEGAAMAMIVASILWGGVAVFGQSNSPQPQNTFAAFGVGTLVGFSMRVVVNWLLRITRTMFGDAEGRVDKRADENQDERRRTGET